MLGVFQVGLKAEIVKVLPAYLHFAVAQVQEVTLHRVFSYNGVCTLLPCASSFFWLVLLHVKWKNSFMYIGNIH